MYSSNKLRKLALIASYEENVPYNIEQFVITILNKQELKEFVRFYKNALQKKRVYVNSSKKLSPTSLSNLQKIFRDKNIIVSIDENLGAGIKIQQADTIIDFTFKKYIDDTILYLKDSSD